MADSSALLPLPGNDLIPTVVVIDGERRPTLGRNGEDTSVCHQTGSPLSSAGNPPRRRWESLRSQEKLCS